MRIELKALTGLRGVAAALVMFYHYGQPFQTRGVDTHFHLRQGYLAVDCFYLLSGFVLAYSYGEWFAGRFEPARFAGFLLRRIARLYPAYLVIMLAVFLKSAINLSGNGALSHYKASDYILNIFMMTGVGLHVYPIIGDSWSLSAEIVAYLCFPVLVFLGVYCRPVIGAMVFCVALAGLLMVAHSGLGIQGPLDVVSSSSTFPTLRCLAEFTIGLQLFRISRLKPVRVLMTSELLCGLAVFVIIAAWMVHATDLVIFACLALLVFGTSFDGALVNRLFANRPVHYLGEISFSLYLIHPTFISATISLSLIFQHRFGMYGLYPVFATMAWALSIKLAEISARRIEAPGRRFVMQAARRLAPLDPKTA